MGVYLSEPETSKKVNVGSQGKVSFVSGEMQGNALFIKAGGRTWKMLPYMNSISEMEIHFLQSSMAMAVWYF